MGGPNLGSLPCTLCWGHKVVKIHSLSDSQCKNLWQIFQLQSHKTMSLFFLDKQLPSHMMAPSIIGKLPNLSINTPWGTSKFLASGPHHPILNPYYGNYNLDSISRIPKTQEITSPWSSTIKAAELVGTPTSKDEVVEQDKVKTTIRYWEFNFKVPLDHNNSKDTRELSLHAKLVYDHHPSGSNPDPETRHWKEAVGKNLDLLLYLCGGPGDANGLKNPALKKAALDRGYQILFVDFRGTGQSGAITKAPDEGAEYLAMFRQDNIVRDLEAIRLCLADELPEPNLKFSLLGQSFGGWIILTYLSFLPSSLKEVGIHAGLPPLGKCRPLGPREYSTDQHKHLQMKRRMWCTKRPFSESSKRTTNTMRGMRKTWNACVLS